MWFYHKSAIHSNKYTNDDLFQSITWNFSNKRLALLSNCLIRRSVPLFRQKKRSFSFSFSRLVIVLSIVVIKALVILICHVFIFFSFVLWMIFVKRHQTFGCNYTYTVRALFVWTIYANSSHCQYDLHYSWLITFY